MTGEELYNMYLDTEYNMNLLQIDPWETLEPSEQDVWYDMGRRLQRFVGDEG